MEKILVTTDQSANSRSAIRFAIKMAKARKAELLILHVYHLIKPFKWSESAFAEYKEKFNKQTTDELTRFIAQVYKSINEPEIKYKLILHDGLDVPEGIMKSAKKHNCAYICISTRGAGTFKKIFGTNTSQLITHATIPVISVPSTYRFKEIKHLLYATDMTNYEVELEKVVAFARPINAWVEMMHISYPDAFVYDTELMEDTLAKKANYKIQVHQRKRDITNTLLEDIDAALKASKASLLVLFTHQSRSMFEKVIFATNAQNYSFHGRVPLLTFNKETEVKE